MKLFIEKKKKKDKEIKFQYINSISVYQYIYIILVYQFVDKN